MYRRGGSKTDHNKATKEQSDSSKYAELLVFGYACKLFRDDERAIYHDQGKHLIPWMGDKNIMIDRYDGRGHLHDLSEYDAGSWNHDYQLSEEEARIEALCDEERYLAMHTDLLEEEARQEEEYKRLSEALADEGTYNAVAFRYSADYYDPSQPTEEDEASKEADQEQQEEESEEPFVAPPGLLIPSDVELPATTKTHAIIERTAIFVCKQGAQFEIVLKAKQAGNSQFDFLRFDHYLNPYYKHILRAMKEGRYTPASEGKQDQKQESKSDDSNDDDDDDDDGDGNYLHPSLFASKRSSRLEEIMKPLQVIDPDHPLAVLVRKVQQENNGAAAMATKAEEEHQLSTVATQAEYTSDPMYYGYCILPDGTYCLAPPPPGIDASPYYTSLPTGMMPAPPASGPPPPPGTTPLLDPVSAIPSAPAAGPVTVSAPASAPLSHSAPAAPPTSSSRPPQTSVAPMVPAAAAPVAAIIPPPPDIQPVIDKLAEYVARNGVKFESSVRAKNDPRFDFLQSWHQYNSYYEFKKHYFMQKEGLSVQEGSLLYNSGGDSTANCSSDKQQNEGKLLKASFAPICFAIKSKENDLLPLEKNRVRLDDDSDEDGMKGEVQEGAELAIGLVEAAREPPQPLLAEEKKPVLSQEELEAKQAKQKLEDRLAAAAREKLAQASKESKERQLQAERKRKAALFLQTLRGPEAEVKRTEETAAAPKPLVSTLHMSGIPKHTSRIPGFDYQPLESALTRSANAPASHVTTSSSSSSSRVPERERDRDRDRDKRKKKHKRRSRSRSRSRSKSKTKHSLPSAYRTFRRSRSQSHSPSRRDRQARPSDRKRDEREKESYGPSTYRLGSNPVLGRKRSRSRSPHEKKKKKGSKSSHQFKGSSCSPSASPDRGIAIARVSASPSPATSPASSLGRSRDGSQEKDKQVSSTIVSSVQSKITQDLMAKVRAMLAASKGLQPNAS
ncbi:splicing factor, suppressor of white-apricot homolog isoform X2 [Sinocyclocheilus rhinocerous]|uniref:Splicing factor, suppressor of white-apricot homolog n=1 Tax=Sinocyclocheilus rhinocerous TaxID=307959 RepID=A0A673IG82_9TELE|nr:PREDICTED: splicing factor, suppressor of white-apricot homolog isoform X1 [Sinocyclocheilus rhinocerous]XP_016403756.1 PREDICTED: splicing factor, suppressor of white-apricot homolog isoform X2 [Sinocyclocheilus rhinocerous]